MDTDSTQVKAKRGRKSLADKAIAELANIQAASEQELDGSKELSQLEGVDPNVSNAMLRTYVSKFTEVVYDGRSRTRKQVYYKGFDKVIQHVAKHKNLDEYLIRLIGQDAQAIKNLAINLTTGPLSIDLTFEPDRIGTLLAEAGIVDSIVRVATPELLGVLLPTVKYRFSTYDVTNYFTQEENIKSITTAEGFISLFNDILNYSTSRIDACYNMINHYWLAKNTFVKFPEFKKHIAAILSDHFMSQM